MSDQSKETGAKGAWENTTSASVLPGGDGTSSAPLQPFESPKGGTAQTGGSGQKQPGKMADGKGNGKQASQEDPVPMAVGDDQDPALDPPLEPVNDEEVRAKTYELTDDQGRLPLGTKLMYGCPGFATTSLSFLISVYANDFYVAMGAGLSFLSFFTALARSFDVMTDPLMGWMSDRTRWKMGRRRPFMLFGAPLYGFFFMMLFWPPPQFPSTRQANDEYPASFYPGTLQDSIGEDATSSSNMAAAYWFGFFYTIFYFSDTVSNVPYEALGPELSDSYDERNKLFFTAKIFNFSGMLFAAAAPATLSYLIRSSDEQVVHILCSLFYHPEATNDAAVRHGTLGAAQLAYQDTDPASGLQQILQAEHCAGGEGSFCFEEWFFNGTRLYYEANSKVIESFCTPGSAMTSDDEACLAAYPDQASTECAEFSRYSMSSLESQQQSYLMVAAIFGLYYVVSQVNLALRVRERPASTEDKAPIPLVPSILRAFQNGAFRPLLMAWGLDGLGLSALVSMFPFFIRYVVIPDGVKAEEGGYAMDSNVCMALSVFGLLLAAMVSSAGWLWLSQRIGKYRSWLVYNAVNAFTNILFMWPAEGDPATTIFVMTINGIPVGGQFLINSITSDVIDYDEFLNGSRSEGAFSVFATLIPKFVSIPAGALPLAIVNMLGFEPPVNGVTVEQTSSVKNFIRYTFVLVPFFCAVTAFLIKTRFPIKTKELTEQINKGIKLHMEGKPATDPLTGRVVELLDLTVEEEGHAWVYENFNVKDLEILYNTDRADHIVRRMRILVAVGALWEVIFLVLVGATFSELDNPSVSIVPILGVIGVGMTTCFLAVSIMRLQGARKLEARSLDADHQAEQKRLLKLVIDAKKSGARAGTFQPRIREALNKVRNAAKFMSASKGRSNQVAAAAEPET